ncbi:heterokaryon incompatibility protein-domain-containing protein [Podospora aff. communis PSN243]|uniref:Heterokaryon incompatibility protein-domain-containing protein n=1 Tax=Podospora aff. communis PSN243 TaxID=3040156 RepID=A0AAV9G9E8_9PEZI|nr:heterokaryon incompatibility protein-domain-containing protein [Podospora aff. communis PSN243]
MPQNAVACRAGCLDVFSLPSLKHTGAPLRNVKMPSQSLCNGCRRLDLRKHVEQPMKQPWKVWQALSKSRPSEKLGEWGRICRKASACPFCRLVSESVRAAAASGGCRLPSSRDVIDLSNRASWKMCILIFNFNSISSKLYSNRDDLEQEAKWIRLKRGREVQRLLVSWPGTRAQGQIQCLANPESNVESRGVRDGIFMGRLVESDQPDWSLLRSWLRHCDRCHGRLCEAKEAESAHERLPANMRVIDVVDKRVVPCRKGWEYVALTYVWGEHLLGRPMPKMDKKRATGRASQASELPKWLPKTISDAMVAVDRLGYRYLWVDSLCIVQDDDQDMHNQLLRMDAIYINASLSIAGASGGHADYGLPGMSVPRKFRQQRARAQGLELAVPLPRFDELNAGTRLKWNTRAWTFQVKVLSRRLLIFTDYQIYFRCSNGVWSEDTAAETTRLSKPDGTKFFRWGRDTLQHEYYSKKQAYTLVDFLNFGSRRLASVDTRASFAHYAAVVQEYTQRTLTKQRDALPAIAGVLRLLDGNPSAYVAGLPRWYFPEAILWHPMIGSTCVEMPGTGAPTWSWARWKLPDGCIWQTRDVKDTTRLDRPMFYWTGDAGPLHIAFHEPASSRLPRTPRRVRRCLGEYGAVLGLGVRLGSLALGERILTGRHLDPDLPDNEVAAFKLHLEGLDEDQVGGVVGEVVTTYGTWADTEDFAFIEISQGTELCFSSGLVAEGYKPKTTKDVWIPAETTTDMDGNTITTKDGHYEKQTVVHPTSTWSVVNVMMIEQVNGLSYRRGLGKVLRSAWAAMDTHRTMVYLA